MLFTILTIKDIKKRINKLGKTHTPQYKFFKYVGYINNRHKIKIQNKTTKEMREISNVSSLLYHKSNPFKQRKRMSSSKK